MRCVVLQPSYIPWRGYFHQMKAADVFVFYDDVQYDKHGWRNRNRIKSPLGSQWLTIPVHSRGVTTHGTPIKDIRIVQGNSWTRKHWDSLQQSYTRTPHWTRYAGLLREFYDKPHSLLADATIELTLALAPELGIHDTVFKRSSEFGLRGRGSRRLLGLLVQLGADRYLTGPSARGYLDEQSFLEAGIEIEYMVYDYPVYPQLYPPYDGQVSVLDLLLMTGSEAPAYIW